jgi:hypothetical protein
MAGGGASEYKEITGGSGSDKDFGRDVEGVCFGDREEVWDKDNGEG